VFVPKERSSNNKVSTASKSTQKCEKTSGSWMCPTDHSPSLQLNQVAPLLKIDTYADELKEIKYLIIFLTETQIY
jgi:hypothetical protein